MSQLTPGAFLTSEESPSLGDEESDDAARR